jgi:hypothetical protein
MYLPKALGSLHARRPLAVMLAALLLVALGVRPSTAQEEAPESIQEALAAQLDIAELREVSEAAAVLCPEEEPAGHAEEEPTEPADEETLAALLQDLIERSDDPEGALAALCELLAEDGAGADEEADPAADDEAAEDDPAEDGAADDPADDGSADGDDADGEGAEGEEAEAQQADGDEAEGAEQSRDEPTIPDVPAPDDRADEGEQGTWRSAGNEPTAVDPAPAPAPAPEEATAPPSDAPPLDDVAMGDGSALAPGLEPVDPVTADAPQLLEGEPVEVPEVASAQKIRPDPDAEAEPLIAAADTGASPAGDPVSSPGDMLPAGYLALALVVFAALRREAPIGDAAADPHRPTAG